MPRRLKSKKQCTLRATSPPIPQYFNPGYNTVRHYAITPSSFLLSMVSTVFLLLICGAHGFQGGRQRIVTFPSISPSFSSGVVYPSLLSTFSLILLPIGRFSVRVGTRLSSGRASGRSSPFKVNNSDSCPVHSLSYNSLYAFYGVHCRS